METTFDRVVQFGRAHGLKSEKPRRRLPVVCVAYPAELRRLGVEIDPSWSGLYDASSERAYFDLSLRKSVTNPQSRRGRAVLEAERITVQHETAHHVIDHLWPSLSRRMPEWLAEGVACSFEVVSDGETDGYRGLNGYRARDLVNMVERGVDAGSMLFPDRRCGPGGAAATRWTGDGYAAAWSIVFYLQRVRADAFGEMLRALNDLRGASSVDAERIIERAVDASNRATWGEVVTFVRSARADSGDARP